MTDGRTDGRTDRRKDGRTDGGDCNIPIAFLKKRGDNNFTEMFFMIPSTKIVQTVMFRSAK